MARKKEESKMDPELERQLKEIDELIERNRRLPLMF